MKKTIAVLLISTAVASCGGGGGAGLGTSASEFDTNTIENSGTGSRGEGSSEPRSFSYDDSSFDLALFEQEAASGTLDSSRFE